MTARASTIRVRTSPACITHATTLAPISELRCHQAAAEREAPVTEAVRGHAERRTFGTLAGAYTVAGGDAESEHSQGRLGRINGARRRLMPCPVLGALAGTFTGRVLRDIGADVYAWRCQRPRSRVG